MPNLLKVRLSLKGRPIRTYTFNKKSITIGRDPASDIFLDNTGVSRSHARIERTPGGYMVEDLGSANGTMLNEQPVRQGYVGHDDVLQIGKFALWLSVEHDRREPGMGGDALGPQALEGTMVIDTQQLLEMQRRARDEGPGEESAAAEASRPTSGPRLARLTCVTAALAAFSLGLLIGATGAFLFLAR